MHILTGILLLAASLTAVVFAATPLYISTPSGVTTGVPTDLIYTAPNMTQAVTILLLKGDPNNLSTIGVLTDDTTSSPYVWTPSTTLAPGNDYAVEITQGNDINYSAQFAIATVNTTALASTSSSASSNAPSTSQSSTSSTTATSLITSSSSSLPAAGAAGALATTNGTTTAAAAASNTHTGAVVTSMTTTTTTKKHANGTAALTTTHHSTGTHTANATRTGTHTRTKHLNATTSITMPAAYSNAAAAGGLSFGDAMVAAVGGLVGMVGLL